jgi:hypothetical protein
VRSPPIRIPACVAHASSHFCFTAFLSLTPARLLSLPVEAEGSVAEPELEGQQLAAVGSAGRPKLAAPPRQDPASAQTHWRGCHPSVATLGGRPALGGRSVSLCACSLHYKGSIQFARFGATCGRHDSGGLSPPSGPCIMEVLLWFSRVRAYARPCLKARSLGARASGSRTAAIFGAPSRNLCLPVER